MEVHFLTQKVEGESRTGAGVGDTAHGFFVHRAVSAFADEMIGERSVVKVFVPSFRVVQHCLLHGAAAGFKVKISP